MKLASFKKGHRGHRGFTLIELLVVIAIIGILSSVVLASLNTARNKGADAAIKSNLANARAEAELYYDSNSNSYGTAGAGTGVCSSTGTNVIGDNVAAALGQGQNVTSYDTVAETCFVTATGWASSVPLKTNTATYYCVDSTGVATTTASYTVGTSDVAC